MSCSCYPPLLLANYKYGFSYFTNSYTYSPKSYKLSLASSYIISSVYPKIHK